MAEAQWTLIAVPLFEIIFVYVAALFPFRRPQIPDVISQYQRAPEP
jgi:hypothetical protein